MSRNKSAVAAAGRRSMSWLGLGVPQTGSAIRINLSLRFVDEVKQNVKADEEAFTTVHRFL